MISIFNKLFLLLLFFNVQMIFTQWQPDVRLTNNIFDTATPYNNARCTAVNGNIIHLIWIDNRDGNYELYYKRSTDAGNTWGPDTRLTNQSAPTLYHSVAVSGNIVHLVWQDRRDVNDQIYYKRSTDGGVSWSTDLRLINTSSYAFNPSLAVSGNFVHAVWHDFRNVNPEIYYKSSSDGGANWGADIRLTNNSSNSLFPSIAVSGNTINVVWHDERDGNYEIYNKRSTDGGVNWGTDTRLTNAAGFSWYSSANVSGMLVSVAWEDNRNGNYEIYYKRSTDGGAAWGTDTRLTNFTGNSKLPSPSSSGQAVHLIWADDRNGNYEIYYRRSTNGGENWDAEIRLTNNSGVSTYPCSDITNSVVHAFWGDNRDGNFEIYHKLDPTGNPIGIQVISSEVPANFKLSQNYPNPFNPKTVIGFQLPVNSFTIIKIYDLLGREITTLVNEQLMPGTYEADWDASKFSSGIYFYRLETKEFIETKRMVLIK